MRARKVAISEDLAPFWEQYLETMIHSIPRASSDEEPRPLRGLIEDGKLRVKLTYPFVSEHELENFVQGESVDETLLSYVRQFIDESARGATITGLPRNKVYFALRGAIERKLFGESMYWAFALYLSNDEEQKLFWRSLFLIAIEIVGMGDTDAVVKIWSYRSSWAALGDPFGESALKLVFVAVYTLIEATKNKLSVWQLFYYKKTTKVELLANITEPGALYNNIIFGTLYFLGKNPANFKQLNAEIVESSQVADVVKRKVTREGWEKRIIEIVVMSSLALSYQNLDLVFDAFDTIADLIDFGAFKRYVQIAREVGVQSMALQLANIAVIGNLNAYNMPLKTITLFEITDISIISHIIRFVLLAHVFLPQFANVGHITSINEINTASQVKPTLPISNPARVWELTYLRELKKIFVIN